MGKLKVIKVGPLSTIQDEGRFGFREYGIPQSGAMDLNAMHSANYLVSNAQGYPAIETAIQGLELEAMAESTIGITGALVEITINGKSVPMNTTLRLQQGDVLIISKPLDGVYSYLGIAGEMVAKKDFGSASTYLMAGFGGFEGRALKKGDILETKDPPPFQKRSIKGEKNPQGEIQAIRIMKGPEWKLLKDLPDGSIFQIDPSSNRMGIRLMGDLLDIDGKEIMSSAVIPGTIQLPHNGIPIVLMNDCQTTGGYPRIGKVIDEDMGLLAQISPGERLSFLLV